MRSRTARIAAQFSRASDAYEQHAALQRAVAEGLALRVQDSGFGGVNPLPVGEGRVRELAPTILDLGAGTGFLTHALRSRLPHARFMALDIAEAMCRKLHPLPTICADMAHLPVATGCMDAVVSSLAFQWLEAPLPALQEMARVLRPGSVLAFTTFTHGTLEPLVSLTTACDVPLALERFPDASVWHHHLTEAGFTVTEHDTTSHTTHYPSLHALLRSFRAIGAGASRPARPLTRGDLRQLESAWQGDYRLGWQVTGFLCNRV